MNIQNNTVTRYWAVTAILLAGAVSGCEYCLTAAIALNIVQVVHFMIRSRSLTDFPVEVRLVYLGLLFLGTAPYMSWIHWWQLAGTTAMVFYQYCFLARCLSLMPWRRQEKLSWTLVRRVFLRPPVKGSILNTPVVNGPAARPVQS